MIDFNHSELVEHYGSWVRVQVAFYDFIFSSALEICGKHFNDAVIQDAIFVGREFKDGGSFYEDSVRKIQDIFETPEKAWMAFLEYGKHPRRDNT